MLVAHEAHAGKWGGPAFYTMATASVGFQAGVSVSENVTLVMTEKGLNSLLANSIKMGGDASVAAGPVGAGAKSDVVADLITFSRAKGVYGGLNLDGTVVALANDWNEAYFGKNVLPPDILIRMSVQQQAGGPAARRGDQGDQEVDEFPQRRSSRRGPRGPFALCGLRPDSRAAAGCWQNGRAIRGFVRGPTKASMPARALHFLLNGEPVEVTSASSQITLLEYLREQRGSPAPRKAAPRATAAPAR